MSDDPASPSPTEKQPDRAILFVDGNNWFHALTDAGIPHLMELDYAKISEKLVGPRQWVETRYYIGAMKQEWNARDYANQRRFLNAIKGDDTRITVQLGRLEPRPMDNPLADELDAWIRVNGADIPKARRLGLKVLLNKHKKVMTLKEKAVDVRLAVDMYKLAVEEAYDAAYLLSHDGDFTPPVEVVRRMGKKVYACAPAPAFSSALSGACNSFIPLEKDWFRDRYR